MTIPIATVTINKLEATLELRDPVENSGQSPSITRSRKLVAVFADPKIPEVEIAGSPGSELPTIPGGRKGIRAVLRFVSNKYDHDGADPRWDQALRDDPVFGRAIGGLTAARGMSKQKRIGRAVAAAYGRDAKPLPMIVENGPDGQRLRISAEKGLGRRRVVHFVLTAQDGTTWQFDQEARNWEGAAHFYWVLLAVAGLAWKMPEGYRDQAFRKWFGKDIGSIVTLPNRGQEHV